MGRHLKIKIISFALSRNRQGADLSELLSQRGHGVTLYELDETPSAGTGQKSYGRIAIRSDILRLDKSNRTVPVVLGAFRRALFLKRALWGRGDIVIAINYPSLRVAALIARLNHGKLIYYPLEFVEDGRPQKRERRSCDRFCDMILDVELNRLALLTKNLKRQIPSFVVPNAPRKGIPTDPRGRLMEYLTDKYGFDLTEKLVLYHGVYHPHACLENIIPGTAAWPNQARLVLMITGKIPERLNRLISRSHEKVVLIPPVKHEELFEWVRDAAIGLLPYEDEISSNVKYCSPQKMFDFLACGVPFIGSKRPLIEEIMEKSKAGVCLDMTNGAEMASMVTSMLDQPARLKEMSRNARKAYEEYYNYDNLIKSALDYMEEHF